MNQKELSATLQQHRDWVLGRHASGKKADLRGANLSEAICIGTKFINARLEGTNLYGVDLRTAVMEYSQMAGVNMTSRFQQILKDKPKTEEKAYRQKQTHEQRQEPRKGRDGR